MIKFAPYGKTLLKCMWHFQVENGPLCEHDIQVLTVVTCI